MASHEEVFSEMKRLLKEFNRKNSAFKSAFGALNEAQHVEKRSKKVYLRDKEALDVAQRDFDRAKAERDSSLVDFWRADREFERLDNEIGERELKREKQEDDKR
jgi:hypothetical protein